MPIDPRYYVNLKGKNYPLYAGVLDCATREGLKSLTTRLIQIPTDDNGGMAIVEARVEMEDGRVFSDFGDCSPKNCAPMIATAAIRMASTRAKGRALRDAINLGETLREELPEEIPDYEPETTGRAAGRPAAAPAEQSRRRAAPAAGQPAPRDVLGDAAVGQPPMARSPKMGSPAAGSDDEVEPLYCNTCGEEMTDPRVVAFAMQHFGQALCVECGQARMQMEKANVPSGMIA